MNTNCRNHKKNSEDKKLDKSTKTNQKVSDHDRTYCVTTETAPGPFVRDDVTYDDMDFLYAYLESFGGEPRCAYHVKDGVTEWMIVSTCECNDCQEYRKVVVPFGSSSLLRAGKYYVLSRAKWTNRAKTYH